MIDMMPFTDRDWAGYAGAERAPDGRPPHIGYALAAGWPEDPNDGAPGRKYVTVIADADGVEVIGIDYALRLALPSLDVALLVARQIETLADEAPEPGVYWNALVLAGFTMGTMMLEPPAGFLRG